MSYRAGGRRFSRLLLSALTIVGLVVSSFGVAAAATQTLVIYGANGAAGQTDSYTDYSMDGGATWHPAYLYGWHPWGFVPGTNSWLNCAPSGDAPECLNRTVSYRIRFSVPTGASNPQMTFDVKADNYASIAVNGTHVADITGAAATTADASIAGAIHTGVNEIRLDVRDTGGLAGLNYKITLTMDAPAPLTLGVPTITTSGVAVNVNAGSTGVVNPGVSLQGFGTVDGATVTINGGFVPSEDRVNFANQNGIAGAYNSATGVLTLSGSATSAAYQAALRSVTFSNTNPNSNKLGPRTITFAVGAGALFNTATGHYYQYAASPGISWSAARDAAANSSLYGLQGYLATITSAAENDFVTAKLQGTGWIGGSDAAQEGVWRWVTGPEAGIQFSGQNKTGWCSAYTAAGINGQYAHWSSGEPNDCGSSTPGYHAEDYAHFYTSGFWNDYPGNAGVQGYVVEYGGMPGDSQPVLSANATVNVVDGTPPTITGAPAVTPNSQGWYNSSVTVHFSCADAGSGIASCGPDQTVSQEGAGQSVTGTAADRAGNTATATVAGISIDTTAPVTTIAAPGVWQNQDVPVTLTATDNLSGVVATYYTVDGGTQQSGTAFTLSDEGAHTITYWSVDAAGNIGAAATASVRIDKTPPTIVGSVDRAANGAGWYNALVTVTFACSDAPSGVATCTGPVTLTGEGAGQNAAGSAADGAGNTATATVGPVNIDLTAPVITYTGNAGSYTVDQIVSIDCAATDSLSGVASDTCAVVTGPAYSFQLGANSVSASATDKADNTATVSAAFTVTATNSSLCSLTQQFVTKKGVAVSLCAKLDAAAQQAAAGHTGASNQTLEAYINEVAAQSGKALTPDRAAILTRLAKSLLQ